MVPAPQQLGHTPVGLLESLEPFFVLVRLERGAAGAQPLHHVGGRGQDQNQNGGDRRPNQRPFVDQPHLWGSANETPPLAQRYFLLAGQVLDDGLWRYTRHPNYFGDFCVWWGIFLVAAETGDALLGVIGPILMTILLTRVSGVPMLEHSMAKRRPGYVQYVERTSAFLPRAPKP